MSIDLTMPRLSDTMEQGTIIKWNVKEGDKVASGQAVADIETDKATMEMQVYDDGTLAKILVKEGQTVPVGTKIAVIAEPGEDAASLASSASESAEQPAESKSSQSKSHAVEAKSAGSSAPRSNGKSASTAAAVQDSPAGGESSGDDSSDADELDGVDVDEGDDQPQTRVRISPVARHMADDHGLDLSTIHGSGPSGRIIKRDILQAIEAKPEKSATQARSTSQTRVPARSSGAAPFKAGSTPLSNMRQTIARRLVESKTTIPHYQLTMTFNMDPLLNLRSMLNEQLTSQGVKLSVNDFLVRACALAIHDHPEFNSSFAGTSVETHPDVNIGVAISLPRERGGGLVVANIRNADQLGLRDISSRTRELADKARTKGLTIDEMGDTTFTISNLGMYGVEHFTAIINPPNTAILAVGAALAKPVVRNAEIVVGNEMSATLSLDHRVIDGAMAAEFMQTLKQLIENPAVLLV